MQRGDSAAYDQFIDQYHAEMMAVALRFLGHHEEAEDCVQDVCILIVTDISKFDRRSSLSTWVHRIVVNKAISMLRRRKPTIQLNVEKHLEQFGMGSMSIWAQGCQIQTLEELLEQDEIHDIVHNAIESLPSNYRSVVILRDILEFSTIETADLLKVAPGAAKVRLHRARLLLRSLMMNELLVKEA
jgi:RNA polymerase sigma-70 factor (ECF subfamily)